MKTVNLQRYSEPDALREISPRMLVALMDEHRPFLASKGVELSAVGSLQPATSAESGAHRTPDPSPQGGEGKPLELDYESLATVFTSLSDIPKDLLERFHMVRQMSGPRQMDRILEAVRARQLEFPLPLDHCSPEDVAAHLSCGGRTGASGFPSTVSQNR